MNQLNARQHEALATAQQRIESITGEVVFGWSVEYHPETRPGRGHDITAWARTDDHITNQFLDPYGNGSLTISEARIVHNDADETHIDVNGNCACEDPND